MSEMTAEEKYQKEYDEAYAKLEAAGSGQPEAITAKETPKEPEAAAKEPETPDPAPEEKPTVDPVEELRQKLEKAEKALKDTQAWGTKNAQKLAEIERQRLLEQREATKPAILAETPELEQAIRYVASDPTPQMQQQDQHAQWLKIVDAAHPGIFQLPDDDELVSDLTKRAQELGNDWHDPLVAIREISATKLAYTERQLAKKYEAEAKQRSQKAAMSVPGPGATTARTAVDPEKEAVDRIQKMSPEEFEKERRRVLGFQ